MTRLTNQQDELGQAKRALEAERQAFALEKAQHEAERDIAILEAEGQAFGDLREAAIELLAEANLSGESVSFSDGRTRSKAELLKALLNRPGPAIHRELSAPEPRKYVNSASFSVPNGCSIDRADQDFYHRVLEYSQSNNINLSEAAEILEKENRR